MNARPRTTPLAPRAPWWMPQPEEDESFADFWIRMGMTTDEIADAITVDFAGAQDVANERLMQVYADRHPGVFRHERRAWLARMLDAQPA